MKETEINEYYDKKYDVDTNLFYQDVWDDVFGAEEWVEDIDDAVGFINHNPAYSTITGMNVIKFYPYEKPNDGFSYMHKLADQIIRSIEFCMTRVFHECEDPDNIHKIPDCEHRLCLEDDCGIAVLVTFDDFTVNVSFYEKK